MFSNAEGTYFDFTVATGGAGTGEISQYITNIIESNTGTQVDNRVGYVQTLKVNGAISQINKYVDSSMLVQMYGIGFTWNLDGTPNVITRVNMDENITETITFEWVDGVANINRVVV